MGLGEHPDINHNNSIWAVIFLRLDHPEFSAVSWTAMIAHGRFICLLYISLLPAPGLDFSRLVNFDYFTLFLMFCLQSCQVAAPIPSPAMARGREECRGHQKVPQDVPTLLPCPRTYMDRG